MNFIKIFVAVLAVSVSFSMLLIHSCSREKEASRSIDDPIDDMAVLEYLSIQAKEVAEKWRLVHKQTVREEGYTEEEMPFEAGLVKTGTYERACRSYPQAYWQKITEETRCIVEITFDCHGEYKSHTSQCIILK